MEAMGLKFIPVIARHILGYLSMLGQWLALFGLIASPKSPNGRYNLPLSTHRFLPPTPLLSHSPTLYNMPSLILQWF